MPNAYLAQGRRWPVPPYVAVMTRTKPADRPTGRTKMITAASIGAVGLAGVFAVGANLGILTSTEQGDVGTVSAAGDLVPVDTRVVDVYLDDPAAAPTATTSAPAGSQRFEVDAAGTVDVTGVDGRARLDLITPAPGWTARSVSAGGADVAVAFTSGDRTLEFTATASADGAVTGDVTESAGVTPSARPDTRQREDDDEQHDDEDHEYEGGDFDD